MIQDQQKNFEENLSSSKKNNQFFVDESDEEINLNSDSFELNEKSIINSSPTEGALCCPKRHSSSAGEEQHNYHTDTIPTTSTKSAKKPSDLGHEYFCRQLLKIYSNTDNVHVTMDKVRIKFFNSKTKWGEMETIPPKCSCLKAKEDSEVKCLCECNSGFRPKSIKFHRNDFKKWAYLLKVIIDLQIEFQVLSSIKTDENGDGTGNSQDVFHRLLILPLGFIKAVKSIMQRLKITKALISKISLQKDYQV